MTKTQCPINFQIPNNFDTCDLGFDWSLKIGHWDF